VTRRVAVVATLACGAALGGSAAGTWVTARAWTPLSERAIAVTGLDASPVLGATALLLVACGLALAMAGRATGRGIAVVVVGAALLAGVSCLTVALDPAGPARGAARADVGVAGVEAAASTPLPWLARAVAAAAAGLGVWTAVAVGGWTRGASGASRYRRVTGAEGAADGTPTAGPGEDDVAAWDALTRGEDPT
jgi:hypothetical protein